MKRLTKNDFLNKKEYKKYKKFEGVFENLIDCHKMGFMITVDNDLSITEPFVDEKGLGFRHGNSKTYWIGKEHVFDKNNKMKVDVCVTVESLKKRICVGEITKINIFKD